MRARERRHRTLISHRTDALSHETPSTRQLTHRLLARTAAQGDAPDVAATAALERAYGDLTRWFGVAGCQALFTRALLRTRVDHPVLAEVRLGGRSEPGIAGMNDMVRAHGAPAAGAALESLLVALLDLLGRLIGTDMAARLLEQAIPNAEDDDANRR